MATTGDEDGQAPALTITCEPLLTRLIAVIGRDGVTYRLRDDVPTDRLIWGFHLLDISERVTQAQTWEEREQALDERDRERLNLITTIVRHSYPQMTRADVETTFTAEQMEELLGYFFTNHLLPLLAQRIASAKQNQDSSAAPAVNPTVGATRSRKR